MIWEYGMDLETKMQLPHFPLFLSSRRHAKPGTLKREPGSRRDSWTAKIKGLCLFMRKISSAFFNLMLRQFHCRIVGNIVENRNQLSQFLIDVVR